MTNTAVDGTQYQTLIDSFCRHSARFKEAKNERLSHFPSLFNDDFSLAHEVYNEKTNLESNGNKESYCFGTFGKKAQGTGTYLPPRILKQIYLKIF